MCCNSSFFYHAKQIKNDSDSVWARDTFAKKMKRTTESVEIIAIRMTAQKVILSIEKGGVTPLPFFARTLLFFRWWIFYQNPFMYCL